VNTHLESQLSRLPEPVPPATLARTIMARVARVAEEQARTAAGHSISREEPVGRWNDVVGYVAALAGVAVVLTSWAAGRLQGRWWLEFVSSQIGASDLAPAVPNGIAVLGLTLGLLLFAAGLLAPLHDTEQRYRG